MRERKVVLPAAAAKSKLGRRNKAAVTRKRPIFRANDGDGRASGFAGPNAPGKFHHLNVAAGTPYDDATFFNRRVDIESLHNHSA
jgi:hypothetical protein